MIRLIEKYWFSGVRVSFLSNGGGAGDGTTPALPATPGFQVPGNPYAIANPDPVGQLLAAYYPLPNRNVTAGSDINFAQNQVRKAPWREENIRVDYDQNCRHPSQIHCWRVCSKHLAYSGK